MSRALLITGATGKQGGAVIKALLAAKADFEVLAVTRDTASTSAQRLAGKSSNIKLVQGNLDDCDSIFKAAKAASSTPIWGVYSVQTPAMNSKGPIIEERQGKALVDAALKNGVKHFVYSSVDRGGSRSSDNATDIPHFVSKHHVERHLISESKVQGMNWTILRPVAFMENFDGGFVGKVFATSWKLVVKRPLQLIATDDIGFFGAKAFMEPETYSGQAISLAGDELKYEEMVDIFKRKTGSATPLTFNFLARFVLWLSKEMGTMFAFFEREGYGADLKELKQTHPGLQNLSTWLETSVYAKDKAI
ncbi:hypothetical protein SLS64_011374 [Diaporthe eres]|uniref:NmrA-like domain-containing protein n=1 Tax=Diaporthe eres TaxID=83184 RepID=A0ABR1NM84_DIAER